MAYFRAAIGGGGGGGMPHTYLYYSPLSFNGTANQAVLYSLHENSVATAARNPATGTVLIDNDDFTITKTSTAYVFQASFKKPCTVYWYDTHMTATAVPGVYVQLNSQASYGFIFNA